MRVSPYESLPEPVVPTPEIAANSLRRDRTLSFKFSQGEVGGQKALLRLTAATYCEMWTPEGLREVLPDALQLAADLSNFGPPKAHRAIPEEEVAKERQKQWANFEQILHERAAQGPMSPKKFNRGARMLDYWLPLWDMRHVARGRPGRAPGVDNRESYFRRFVLDGESTNSPPFNTIFRVIQRFNLSGSPPFTQDFLRGMWEYHHPGQSFYSERFREELQENGTRYARARYLHVPSIARVAMWAMAPGLNKVIQRQQAAAARKKETSTE